MKKIISVVGARPNFMKIAPIHRALASMNLNSYMNNHLEHLIVHTGQHYDFNLSDAFIRDLELPKPDYFLGVGSGTHSEQTAKIMIEFEKVVQKENPDLIIVVGDVNSTIACGLVAAKQLIPLAHIEAGLRSFDRTMPEEINRVLTDTISNFHFITEKSAYTNLINEGVDPDNIFFVGNTMIDSLIFAKNKVDNSKFLENNNLKKDEYVVVTLHRPSNVDNRESLAMFYDIFEYLSYFKKIIFPVHPRTTKMMKEFNIYDKYISLKNLIMVEPMNYIDFLNCMMNAYFVMTDSGGIQEETTYLDIPCITLRTTTERPITIELGTNRLINPEPDIIKFEINNIIKKRPKRIAIPPLWDGNAGNRIATIIVNNILN
ncbi:MAG TPA: UDP-N-acetylglucosamine 2-epimerase (non-hydrolyzing) [Bacteroidota bacterium]|nr:UDP-N-acetylglucosamine 2-epimerase (non-hydrolyzing) [Bacteroidota bacterium]